MTSVYELKIGAEKLEVLLAIGEELTTLANTLNAAKEKLLQIANGNDDALKSLAELKKEILAEQEKINAILSAANEQAAQTLSAAQSQAEQTAKLAKEATEQNAASAKSAQQKAAEILASIEKLQEQIKATADKVENAGALLTELNSLKEQIKTLLQNGIINDAAQSATQTYSSNLIERKLETKASAGYGYSKIEANAKFDNLAQGINTAISAAAAAQSSADSKLGKDDQAADSAKLGGAAADKYMKSDKYNPTAASSPNTLVLRDANGDFKARRVTAGNFLTTEKAQDDAIDEHSEICYRAAQSSEADPKQMRFATLGKIISLLKVEAATEAKAGIVKIKKQIGNTPTDDVVPTEKAVADALAKGFSNSKLQNGYTKFPNGLILQWGKVTEVPADRRKKAIFPIAFPTACLNASVTYEAKETEMAHGGMACLANISRTQMDVEYQAITAEYAYHPTITIYWFAIGH